MLKSFRNLRETDSDEYVVPDDEDTEATTYNPRSSKERNFKNMHSVNVVDNPASNSSHKADHHISVTVQQKNNGEQSAPKQGSSDEDEGPYKSGQTPLRRGDKRVGDIRALRKEGLDEAQDTWMVTMKKGINNLKSGMVTRVSARNASEALKKAGKKWAQDPHVITSQVADVVKEETITEASLGNFKGLNSAAAKADEPDATAMEIAAEFVQRGDAARLKGHLQRLDTAVRDEILKFVDKKQYKAVGY